MPRRVKKIDGSIRTDLNELKPGLGDRLLSEINRNLSAISSRLSAQSGEKGSVGIVKQIQGKPGLDLNDATLRGLPLPKQNRDLINLTYMRSFFDCDTFAQMAADCLELPKRGGGISPAHADDRFPITGSLFISSDSTLGYLVGGRITSSVLNGDGDLLRHGLIIFDNTALKAQHPHFGEGDPYQPVEISQYDDREVDISGFVITGQPASLMEPKQIMMGTASSTELQQHNVHPAYIVSYDVSDPTNVNVISRFQCNGPTQAPVFPPQLDPDLLPPGTAGCGFPTGMGGSYTDGNFAFLTGGLCFHDGIRSQLVGCFHIDDTGGIILSGFQDLGTLFPIVNQVSKFVAQDGRVYILHNTGTDDFNGRLQLVILDRDLRSGQLSPLSVTTVTPAMGDPPHPSAPLFRCSISIVGSMVYILTFFRGPLDASILGHLLIYDCTDPTLPIFKSDTVSPCFDWMTMAAEDTTVMLNEGGRFAKPGAPFGSIVLYDVSDPEHPRPFAASQQGSGGSFPDVAGLILHDGVGYQSNPLDFLILWHWAEIGAL